jgi:hypothetical protein
MFGFAGKDAGERELEQRLANRRLQPLGHLTANGKYTAGKYLRDPISCSLPTTVFQTAAFVRRIPAEAG